MPYIDTMYSCILKPAYTVSLQYQISYEGKVIKLYKEF